MDSLFPTISMSELQKNAKKALAAVKHYAVVQSHGRDRAVVLHPEFGRFLIESGMFAELVREWQKAPVGGKTPSEKAKALKRLIGPVLRELSKK